MASWTDGARFVDPDAWDRDWMDSDKISGGDDNSVTDQPSTAIAMYSGHGSCNEWTTQTCTHSSACTSPGAGQSAPGACSGVLFPRCNYFVPRTANLCGSGDAFGHQANLSSGNARFGESTPSGGWAGAGTNGNVNMVIMDISCGGTPGQEVNEYWNAFAG